MVPAMRALRYSRASSASRQAVLAALARYSDPQGGNAYPSVTTLMQLSKAARATVVAALAEALENGDIIRTGQRPSRSWIYSFAPLIERAAHGSAAEPSSHSSATEPPESHGSISASHGSISPDDGSVTASHGSAAEPDEVEEEKKEKREEEQPSSYFLEPEQPTAAERHRRQAEREDDLSTLHVLRAQLPTSRHPQATQRSIEAIEVDLGLVSDDPVVAAELDSWAGWVGSQLDAMAVAT